MKEYDFKRGIMPINRQNCFEDADYWTWCGSAVKGDDGKYYLFAARWSKQRPFFSGYVFSSEVVCAETLRIHSQLTRCLFPAVPRRASHLQSAHTHSYLLPSR